MENIQNVTVERIMDNRNNPKSPFKTLMLKCERQKAANNSGGLTNFLLGGNNTEKLTALQVVHEDVIAQFKLQEGSQFNELVPEGAQIKLVVSEISESEYQALESTAQIPYGRSAKLNPTSGEYLITEDGEYIRRAVLVTPVGEEAQDKYLPHTGSTAEAPAQREVKATVEDTVGDDLPA